MTLTETNTDMSDVKRRGEAIYRERLQSVLEPEHDGAAVAIDVESGDYIVDRSWAFAVRRLREQRPEGYVFARFIGPATPAENALAARLTPGSKR